jgi:hypothetical protein
MLGSALFGDGDCFAASDAMKVLKAEFRRWRPPNSSEWPPLAPGNRTEDCYPVLTERTNDALRRSRSVSFQ